MCRKLCKSKFLAMLHSLGCEFIACIDDVCTLENEPKHKTALILLRKLEEPAAINPQDPDIDAPNSETFPDGQNRVSFEILVMILESVSTASIEIWSLLKGSIDGSITMYPKLARNRATF
mmetsp:Transcript_9105/g.16384  ORF Transcript_9105/g.16384 Transcript_9105/m.16384 type:complete len:120 (-) Transcript_9105:392-751(-)